MQRQEGLSTLSVTRMLFLYPFDSGFIVTALHSGGICVTLATQFRWTGGGESPPHPTRAGRISAPFFSPKKATVGVSSLHRFYARGIVACRVSRAELDSAMRTQAESEACEVYCISGNGHAGCSAVRVSRGARLKDHAKSKLSAAYMNYCMFKRDSQCLTNAPSLCGLLD